MYNGVIFPLLPMSILYGTTTMSFFDDVFTFAFIAEQLELNFNGIEIYHFSVSFLFSVSFFLHIMDHSALGILHTSLKWFIL